MDKAHALALALAMDAYHPDLTITEFTFQGRGQFGVVCAFRGQRYHFINEYEWEDFQLEWDAKLDIWDAWESMRPREDG